MNTKILNIEFDLRGYPAYNLHLNYLKKYDCNKNWLNLPIISHINSI
jgi:hypothetical protein